MLKLSTVYNTVPTTQIRAAAHFCARFRLSRFFGVLFELRVCCDSVFEFCVRMTSVDFDAQCEVIRSLSAFLEVRENQGVYGAYLPNPDRLFSSPAFRDWVAAHPVTTGGVPSVSAPGPSGRKRPASDSADASALDSPPSKRVSIRLMLYSHRSQCLHRL